MNREVLTKALVPESTASALLSPMHHYGDPIAEAITT